MPETLSSRNPFEGGDPALSVHLEEEAKAHDFTHILPQHREEGDVIVGNSINPDFNKGVEQGPWQADPYTLEEYRQYGWSDEDIHALADLREKQRLIRVNTYPVIPIGDMKEVYDELGRQERTLFKKQR